MLRLAFDFIITWRETRTRPNAYLHTHRRPFFHNRRLFFLYLQNLFQYQLLLKKLKPRNYE